MKAILVRGITLSIIVAVIIYTSLALDSPASVSVFVSVPPAHPRSMLARQSRTRVPHSSVSLFMCSSSLLYGRTGVCRRVLVPIVAIKSRRGSPRQCIICYPNWDETRYDSAQSTHNKVMHIDSLILARSSDKTTCKSSTKMA